MQTSLYKMVDATSGTATQLVVSLPAKPILPATATGLTGITLQTLDGLLMFTMTSGATALSAGLTVYGDDVAGTIAASGVAGTQYGGLLTTFAAPTAATQCASYAYGLGVAASGVGSAGAGNDAFGFIMDKLTFTVTPGTATTVRLLVYGVRYI